MEVNNRKKFRKSI